VKRRAFTLIEFLTVTAIVTVLVGITFPVYGAVRRRADHTVCAESLHQLGVAMTLYANDHEGWVPPATTAEFLFSHLPGIVSSELQASPSVLRRSMEPYVKAEPIWFCPADAKAHRNVLWLAQRHQLTSYFFYPQMPGQLMVWPPRMQLGRDASPNKPSGTEDVPLFCDASGLPRIDSDPAFPDIDYAMSNHSDHLVNAIRHDLSLSRLPAKEWEGSEK